MKRFKMIAEEIGLMVSDWEIKFKSISEENITIPRNLQDRSVKQIVGHMIDSVSNNTHRIVHLQYQESPFEFPNYAANGNNDKWIAIQNYQNAKWEELIQHWKYAHLHFAYVIQNIDPDKLDNKWISDKNETITLQKMVEDFPGHFKLHIDQIIELLSTSLQ
ncbi:MAG: DinB family protein [Bacteroidetes bacterium]|nr:DinB family protein [Bacteroidota bacterium]